jgi:hypothetical protein
MSYRDYDTGPLTQLRKMLDEMPHDGTREMRLTACTLISLEMSKIHLAYMEHPGALALDPIIDELRAKLTRRGTTITPEGNWVALV